MKRNTPGKQTKILQKETCLKCPGNQDIEMQTPNSENRLNIQASFENEQGSLRSDLPSLNTLAPLSNVSSFSSQQLFKRVLQGTHSAAATQLDDVN